MGEKVGLGSGEKYGFQIRVENKIFKKIYFLKTDKYNLTLLPKRKKSDIEYLPATR